MNYNINEILSLATWKFVSDNEECSIKKNADHKNIINNIEIEYFFTKWENKSVDDFIKKLKNKKDEIFVDCQSFTFIISLYYKYKNSIIDKPIIYYQSENALKKMNQYYDFNIMIFSADFNIDPYNQALNKGCNCLNEYVLPINNEYYLGIFIDGPDIKNIKDWMKLLSDNIKYFTKNNNIIIEESIIIGLYKTEYNTKDDEYEYKLLKEYKC